MIDPVRIVGWLLSSDLAVVMFVRATAVLIATGLLGVALRRRSSATRHAVWLSGLLALVALPLISGRGPQVELVVPIESGEHVGMATVSGSVTTSLPPAPATPRSGTAASLPSFDPGVPVVDIEPVHGSVLPEWRPDSADGWLLLLWWAGFAVLLGRLLAGSIWFRRAWRAAAETGEPVRRAVEDTCARLGLRSAPRVRSSDRVDVPLVWGIRRPAVLLPADAETWPAERLRMVLLHELAHVVRRDTLGLLVAQLAAAVHWLNPLAWMAVRAAHEERERACDDMVLSCGAPACDYAAELLAIARNRHRPTALATGVGLAERTALGRRVRAILRRDTDRRAGSAPIIALAVIAIVGLTAAASIARPIAGRSRAAVQIDDMIDRLDNGDREVRLRAAWSLGERESPRAVDALVQALETTDAELRAMAAWALGEIKDGRAVLPLLAHLGDTDDYAREMIVLALGEIEAPAATMAIAGALDDPADGVRIAAAWALGEIRDVTAIVALHQAATASPDAAVRVFATGALPRLLGARAVPTLVQLVADADVQVRTTAATALGTGSPLIPALEALGTALADPHPSVRSAAARALGTLRHPAAVDPLIARLRDPDPGVRTAAIWALDEIEANPTLSR